MVKHIYTDFDEWMDEIEIHSLRRERFENDADIGNIEVLTMWLRTAWELGAASKGENE